MSSRACRRAGAGVLALLLALPVGCGGNAASVSGTITYEGSTVEYGTIAFYPIDGTGPSEGGPIRDGRYSISVAPGRSHVVISGAKNPGRGFTAEEALAMKATYKGDSTVPEDAIGNGATVELTVGNQTHDFDLRKPPPKKQTARQGMQPMDPKDFLRKGRR